MAADEVARSVVRGDAGSRRRTFGADLQRHYPTLRLETNAGRVEIRGTFPILDTDGSRPGSLAGLNRTAERRSICPADREGDWKQDSRHPRQPRDRHRRHRMRVAPRGTLSIFSPRSSLQRPTSTAHCVPSSPTRVTGRGVDPGCTANGSMARSRPSSSTRSCLNQKDDAVGWRGLIAMGLGLVRAEIRVLAAGGGLLPECHADLIAVRDNLGQANCATRG